MCRCGFQAHLCLDTRSDQSDKDCCEDLFESFHIIRLKGCLRQLPATSRFAIFIVRRQVSSPAPDEVSTELAVAFIQDVCGDDVALRTEMVELATAEQQTDLVDRQAMLREMGIEPAFAK